MTDNNILISNKVLKKSSILQLKNLAQFMI